MSAETSSAKYEVGVDPDVPNNSHSFAVQLTGTGKRVLELGATGGHVTQVLVDRGNEVTAVEVDPSATDRLRIVTREVVLTDLDWLDLETHIKGKFDVIIAGDVLEHLMFPEAVLLMLRDFIKADGYLIVSLPNVTHADVALRLLLGEFEYMDIGLLDRTHIRFFDRKRAIDLLESSGWSVAEAYGTTAPLGTTEQAVDVSLLPPQAVAYLQSRKDSTLYQFVFKARPTDGHHPGVSSTRRGDQKWLKNQNLLLELSASGHREEALKRALEKEQRMTVDKSEEITRLTGEVFDAERRAGLLESIEADFASVKERNANLESAVFELNRIIKNLRRETDELMSRVTQREARVRELEAGNRRLRDRLDEALKLPHASA